MSIESFCNQYPASPDVRVIVDTGRTEGQSHMSSVVILAAQLAREGQDGARKIINKLNPSNTMSKVAREDFQHLSVGDRRDMFINYAGFVFGNSVVSLEKTLVNTEYDHEEFCRHYNLGINSFELENITAGTEEREKLSFEQLTRMRSLIKQDLTFAIFFEEKGLQALPNILRQFLEERQIISVIQRDILPIYKPRADFLIAQK